VDRQASSCARGRGDEPAAHGALARPARLDLGTGRFQGPGVLAPRNAYQHLFYHTPIQRVRVGEGLKRRQADFFTVSPHARPANLHLPPAEDHLTRDRSRADRRAADGAARGNRLGGTDRLCETLSSWRLLAGRLSPRLSHRLYSTTNEEPPLSNFNSYRDIPVHGEDSSVSWLSSPVFTGRCLGLGLRTAGRYKKPDSSQSHHTK
jgi:hypothetical protein